MKPQRKQKHEGDQGTSSFRPRNIARICLDGENGEEAEQSFREGIESIFAWCKANGIVVDVSSIFGPNVEVVTTPVSGTFHLELEYDERILEVLINGRDLYVMGWRSPNGSFEIIEEDPKLNKKSRKNEASKNYMLGDDVKPVFIGKNYCDLSPKGEVGEIKLGIHELRRCFNALYDHKGGSTGYIKEPVGTLAVYLSEATRFFFVEEIGCASIIHESYSRLKQAVVDLIWLQRWSHLSGELMKYIHCILTGKTPPKLARRGVELQSIADIVPIIRVLHVDGFKPKEGKFAHAPPPEVMIEQPIDPPEEMGNNKNKIKKQSQRNNWKSSEQSLKESASKGRGAHPSRRKFTTYIRPPPVQSWRRSVQEKREVRELLTSLSRGCGENPSSNIGAPAMCRRYKKTSLNFVPSSPPTQLDAECLERVQGNSRVCDFLALSRGGFGRSGGALRQMGAPPVLSDYMAQSPAMRPSLQSSDNKTASQHRAQLSRRTFANKLECKVNQYKTSVWSLLRRSAIPVVRLRSAKLQKRRALLIQTVLRTQQLRTVVSVTQDVEYRVVRKTPILQAGPLLSRLLRLLRR